MMEQLGQQFLRFKFSKIWFRWNGIQTAALAFGGLSPESATEEYDGTTWTTLLLV
jgi:hypothetical protein